jgi:hypothetical protein
MQIWGQLASSELALAQKKAQKCTGNIGSKCGTSCTIHTFFITFLLLPFAALHPYPSPNQTPPSSFSYPSPTPAPAPASHNVSLSSPIQHQNLMMCCQGCNFVLHHPLSCSKE